MLDHYKLLKTKWGLALDVSKLNLPNQRIEAWIQAPTSTLETLETLEVGTEVEAKICFKVLYLNPKNKEKPTDPIQESSQQPPRQA